MHCSSFWKAVSWAFCLSAAGVEEAGKGKLGVEGSVLSCLQHSNNNNNKEAEGRVTNHHQQLVLEGRRSSS